MSFSDGILALLLVAVSFGMYGKVVPVDNGSKLVVAAGWCAPAAPQFLRKRALEIATSGWPSTLDDGDRDWLIAMLEPALEGREDEVAYSWLKRTRIRG